MFSRYVLPGVLVAGFVGMLGWAARDAYLPRRPVTVVPVLVSVADVQMAGTPLFMAPELLGGGQASFKADIYSTAATIYRMLTGRHPIEAKRLNDWLVAVQSQAPPLAREVQPSIPEKVSAALARALDRDPDRRQPTMRDFRKELL